MTPPLMICGYLNWLFQALHGYFMHFRSNGALRGMKREKSPPENMPLTGTESDLSLIYLGCWLFFFNSKIAVFGLPFQGFFTAANVR